MFPNSIRWRLQLWLGFLLVCVLSGFGVTIYQLQRTNQLSQIDEELERRVAALSGAVRGGIPPDAGPKRSFGGGPRGREFEEGPRRPPPDGFRLEPPGSGGPRSSRFGPPGMESRELRLPSAVAGLFADTRTDAFYFVAWFRDGSLLGRSTNAPSAISLPVVQARDTRTHVRMRNGFREAFHFTELGDCVLAGCSITAHLGAMRRFKLWLLAAGGTVLAFGLGVGWWLTTRAIRPVEEISAAASRISAGNLSERVRVSNAEDELGRLAGVLNTTFARLEAAFARQKQFTADASHELRTPLALLISEAQITLSRERSASEYRETVEACLDVAQQMRRLTESLLELARCDAGFTQVERATIDLAEITRSCVERVGPLAAQRKIQIQCDFAPAEALGNAEWLGQVVSNLLNNAVHYNRLGGTIRVRTGSDNGVATVTIADTGQGIAAEDLPHIFERFYRADKSRSSADGHWGLGLAICQAIVEADCGNIRVQSTVGVGSEFTVVIPHERP